MASATCIGPLPTMAWPQKECSRAVSRISRPALDLNHWRVGSIREIATIGTSKVALVSRVMRSNAGSGSLSRTR